ncbi:UNVERIFIED_CONTAM: hypothetical protein GTU68_020717 [Idotea baltica]|nr:hypothetical protein [Idotea baltica]
MEKTFTSEVSAPSL